MEPTLGDCRTDHFGLGNPGVLRGKDDSISTQVGSLVRTPPLSQILNFGISLVDSISTWQWQQEDVTRKLKWNTGPLMGTRWSSRERFMDLSILKSHVRRRIVGHAKGGG